MLSIDNEIVGKSNFLEMIPNEMQIEILSHLGPAHIADVKSASKKINQMPDAIQNLLWNKKFQLHLPHFYQPIAMTKNINWYLEFKKAYQSEYKGLLKNNYFLLLRKT